MAGSDGGAFGGLAGEAVGPGRECGGSLPAGGPGLQWQSRGQHLHQGEDSGPPPRTCSPPHPGVLEGPVAEGVGGVAHRLAAYKAAVAVVLYVVALAAGGEGGQLVRCRGGFESAGRGGFQPGGLRRRHGQGRAGVPHSQPASAAAARSK